MDFSPKGREKRGLLLKDTVVLRNGTIWMLVGVFDDDERKKKDDVHNISGEKNI